MIDVRSLEGSAVHVLEQDLDLAGVVEHIVAFDNVKIVDVAEDLDFAADLAAYGVFVVPVDNFEGVVFSGGSVDDFVDGATAAASDSVHSVELGEV